MPTNFPTGVDNFTNPTANDSLNLPSHSTQHANANDAIEAVEDYLLNGAGNSGLVLVKTQTVGTTVASVNVTGAFNASYQNYLILLSGGIGSVAETILFRLGSTITGYKWNMIYTTFGNTSLAVETSSNATSFNYAGATGANNGIVGLNVFSPFLAAGTFVNSTWVSVNEGGRMQGIINNTTSYTDFTLFVNSGTLTGGTIKVYGYK
jgi:hypothetical protein